MQVLGIRKGRQIEQEEVGFGIFKGKGEFHWLVGLYSGFGLEGPRNEFLELESQRDFPSWQGGKPICLVEF